MSNLSTISRYMFNHPCLLDNPFPAPPFIHSRPPITPAGEREGGRVWGEGRERGRGRGDSDKEHFYLFLLMYISAYVHLLCLDATRIHLCEHILAHLQMKFCLQQSSRMELCLEHGTRLHKCIPQTTFLHFMLSVTIASSFLYLFSLLRQFE